MSVTAFSQYKVYEYANSGTPALATYTGMTFTQDGTNFLDALSTSSQSVVSMPVSYIAACDSNYRYNVAQMTAYSNIGANFPSNGGYEFENQTTKFVLKIKDLRGNIAYSKDLEIDMNTTYFGFFMNSNGIGGVIIYRINDANCDVVIKGNSTFDNMYKTVYTIDGRDPLPDLEGGGAGSGYIGNSLVSNKKMVGYNVPTSSAEGTKTESVNEVSASAVSGKPKSGNGFARIKFLREIDFFGFIEHMNITDSSTRFEYIGENTGYTPLTVDLSGTHLPLYNSWSDFSYLFKNKPYMVKADGTADYQLSETDYTKKVDGVTASDVKNASYNGCGAFAWLPKIYTKQEIVGNDRYVYFSLTPKTGYDALGFKCSENGVEQELEGLWIPMFYGVTSNNKLMSICNDGKPSYGGSIALFKSQIENLSSRARFFGGAIINVIADLLILLSRKGDIPTVFGNGVINASQSAWYPDTTIPTQSVVGTDRFWGYNDGNHLTKIFHSLLSSGILWQYDPYFKVKNSKFYHCPHYEWGEDVASDISAETTSGYYYATQFGLVDGFGRVPIHPMSSTAIEPYYMYTNSLISPSDSYSCRNGNYGTGRRGWYARIFDSNFNYTAWDRNASPMILPPVGYKPE